MGDVLEAFPREPPVHDCGWLSFGIAYFMLACEVVSLEVIKSIRAAALQFLEPFYCRDAFLVGI